MAKLDARPSIICECNLLLSENEMRFLDALVGYGWEAFHKTFKEKLGTAYIQGHEKAAKDFFESVRLQIPNILGQIDRAREAFERS